MKLFLLSLTMMCVQASQFAPTASAKEVDVQMKSISFAPKQIEITAGDTVVWKNISYTNHSATGDAFDTGMVKPKGESKAITFATPGTYTYNCKMHGKTMSGTVQVDANQLNTNQVDAK